MKIFNRVFQSLLKKEFRQLLRNRQIVAILFFIPALQIILFGFALSPDVKHLRLGVIDLAHSSQSRELIAAFVRNQVFDLVPAGNSSEALFKKVADDETDAAIVIPPEFQRTILQRRPVEIQVVLNGTDANTAGIASGYISQIVNAFNKQLNAQIPAVSGAARRATVAPAITFAYNPGLISSWFFVPAIIAMSLNAAGTMISSAALLKEKETGTIEQLLMTPATSEQILIAKILPLITLLFGVVALSTTVGMVIFGIPFRGNVVFFTIVALLYMFVLISLGLALATYTNNQRQAMLTMFFIMMPLIQLSGALAPIESMPDFFQMLSQLNPLRYYIACVRGIMLKGNSIAELYPNIMALSLLAMTFLIVSVRRFRAQLE